jgi:Zn-dependent metalloprotease
MSDNGLHTFALHRDDELGSRTIGAINNELRSTPSVLPVERLDPESVAQQYLNQILGSPSVPTLTSDDTAVEYHAVGTETVPLTDSTVVKFAQYRAQIPVYGSLVSVELDENNSMLSISSALGNPDDVDAVASVSPAEAQNVIAADAGDEALPLAAPPKLYFYYDSSNEPGRWRLVYIAKNVQRYGEDVSEGHSPTLPEVFDYVVDAHSDDLVAKLPRTQNTTWTPQHLNSTDDLGQSRPLRAQSDGSGNQRLVDPSRRIETYDFQFRKIEPYTHLLPGKEVSNPPDPWSPAAISAHANAQEVADYIFTTLRRNGLDGAGGPFVSTINCLSVDEYTTTNEWHNAAWVLGTQMVYGQQMVSGKLRSWAAAKDIVAHEMTHGLTEHTARLEYRNETGALNESYSDIFGVIIANAHQSDIDKWDWEIGEKVDSSGMPLRDLSDPARRVSDPNRCDQPAHMKNFLVTKEDHGGVHTNSGIHNKAAFNLITAKDNGEYLFKPEEAAALFYLALRNRLTETSDFSASRQAVELSAKSLFRTQDLSVRNKKLAAIAAAFDAVGIA